MLPAPQGQAWPAPGPVVHGAGSQVSSGAPNARRAVVVIAVVLVAAVVLAGVAYGFRGSWLPAADAGRSAGPSGEASTAPPTTAPTRQQTPAASQIPSAPPTAIGAVALDPSLDQSRAPEVARLFDTFFGGINTKNYAAAVAMYDPAGPVNPNDRSSVAKFTADISTTTDDDIVLRSVTDDTSGKGVVQARVTFRSRQDPGKGPAGRESETCTRWDVTYILSRPSGKYLIKGASRATSTPC
jgi:hypothetical protein